MKAWFWNFIGTLADGDGRDGLLVTVEGNSIAAKPGMEMWISYEKDPNGLSLLLKATWLDVTTTSPPAAKFRGDAFRAAIEKARELRWVA
jgi:hypothetical protein